jgi:HAD superfamily hydrolase (TIGR01490 family)
VKLAIFDLDNTLIAGDSDHAWGMFLVDRGVVNKGHYRQQNDRFYADYCEGKLNVYEYQRFVMTPLISLSVRERMSLHNEFMANCIAPLRLSKADELLTKHRQAGDHLLIITSTNRFIAGPIASLLGVSTLLATEPEIVDDKFTGAIIGTPCYQHGKVQRLNQWLESQQATLESSCFYSDSINDVPLLEWVDYPVVVDPDEKLRDYADQKRWPIISLRE